MLFYNVAAQENADISGSEMVNQPSSDVADLSDKEPVLPRPFQQTSAFATHKKMKQVIVTGCFDCPCLFIDAGDLETICAITGTTILAEGFQVTKGTIPPDCPLKQEQVILSLEQG